MRARAREFSFAGRTRPAAYSPAGRTARVPNVVNNKKRNRHSSAHTYTSPLCRAVALSPAPDGFPKASSKRKEENRNLPGNNDVFVRFPSTPDRNCFGASCETRVTRNPRRAVRFKLYAFSPRTRWRNIILRFVPICVLSVSVGKYVVRNIFFFFNTPPLYFVYEKSNI